MFQSRISTVRQPAEEMGRRGVELLLAMIKGKVKRNTKVTLKPEIIPRGTTK
jgi:LacI family transcriptional regulator